MRKSQIRVLWSCTRIVGVSIKMNVILDDRWLLNKLAKGGAKLGHWGGVRVDHLGERTRFWKPLETAGGWAGEAQRGAVEGGRREKSDHRSGANLGRLQLRRRIANPAPQPNEAALRLHRSTDP